MKIALITEHRPLNYGSVLQTFATQSLLEQMGYTVEVIDYWRLKDIPQNQVELALKYHPNWRKNALFKVLFKWLFPHINMRRVRKIFDGFLARRVHLSEQSYFSLDELKSNYPKADFYLSGSDQLWNSGIHNTDAYYLDFLQKNEPRGSFATSFGRNTIPQEELAQIRPKLNKYRFLSVREKTGLDIIKLAGVTVPAQSVLDPTMVVLGDVWDHLANQAKALTQENESYLLLFQINYGTNEKLKDFADHVAEKYHCKFVSVEFSVKHKHYKGCRHILSPSPEELLRLLRDAQYVITDSFHGTVFCLNFRRDFAVDYPPKYKGRIENLLNIAGLSNRILTGYSNTAIFEKRLDYCQIDDRLLPLKHETYHFLQIHLKEVENEISL